jgi:hypothetical protein
MIEIYLLNVMVFFFIQIILESSMDFVEVFVIFIGDLYEEWFLIEKVDRIV